MVVDVDPSGEYIIGNGKLVSWFNGSFFDKNDAAIEAKKFDGEAYGAFPPKIWGRACRNC